MSRNSNLHENRPHLPKKVAEALSPELAALHRRWVNVLAAIDAEDENFDRATSKKGKGRADRASQVAAIRARQNLLWRRKRDIIHGVVSLRSRSFAELAIKMRLWRSESAHWTNGVFDDLDGPCAFSAYRDLLRLTGIKSLNEKLDQRSLRRIRDGRFLAGDQRG